MIRAGAQIVLLLMPLCLSALGLSTAAVGADVKAASAIDAVTVFPSGAEVTRNAKVELAAGESTLIFEDLPAETVPGSIRVEGQSAGSLQIGSVDQRRLFVPQSGGDDSAERRRLESEIENLKDQRLVLEGNIQAAQTQQTLLNNIANLPNVPPGREGGAAAKPDWVQLLGIISAGINDVQQTMLTARVEMRDIDKKVADLEKKLAELAPKRIERTEVKVLVIADAALEADITLKYQVRSASWRPSYEARLQTGDKETSAKLQLVKRATISQSTGEPWKNVAVSLSTTRPTSGSTAPELRPLLIDILEPRKPPPVAKLERRMRAQKQDMAMADEAQEEDARAGYGAANRRPTVAVTAAPAPAAPVVAEVEASPFQAVFSVPGRTDIDSTGEQKNAVIAFEDFEPALQIKTVPKKAAKAFLYAKLKRAGETPLLAGPVTLFRDGTFVGKGKLPLIAGEEHELGFGADDLVRVKHAVVQEKRGETGLISTTRIDDRNYKMSVKNLHKQKVNIIVLDQLPVSKNEKIEVTPARGTEPTKKDVDDKRGVVAWEFALEPDEEKTINFGYVVRWPPEKEIIYRNR